MASKILTKIFNNEKQIIPSGFLPLHKDNSKVSFSSILSQYKSSLVFVDTEGVFIKDAIIETNMWDIESKALIIGLVSNDVLLKLKQDGIKNGFYRSTAEKIGTGLIILNKTKVYSVLNIDSIYPICDDSASKEIFQMINHIIWSKTDKEYFGTLKEVKDIRLSVVAPDLKLNVIPNSENNYEFCSNTLFLNADTRILNKPISTPDRDYVVIENCASRMFGSFSKMNIEVFSNIYYPFILGDNQINYISFKDKQIGELVGKEILVSNKRHLVNAKDILEKDDHVYLEEYDNYEPNFESYLKQYDGYSREIQINVVVHTITLDDTYQLSKKYQTIKDISAKIENGLVTIGKLLEDNEETAKQINSIRKEKVLVERIKMFNELVNNKEFGVASLNNKKSPVTAINGFNENDIKVPNEIIGVLYKKNNNDYLATSMDKVKDALNWLKDNNIQANLIEKNG